MRVRYRCGVLSYLASARARIHLSLPFRLPSIRNEDSSTDAKEAPTLRGRDLPAQSRLGQYSEHLKMTGAPYHSTKMSGIS